MTCSQVLPATSSARGSAGSPEGLAGHPAYTPAVRRWVCIIAVLVGFSGDGYVWAARPRIPVPVERLIDPDRARDEGLPEVAWWRLG